MEIEDLPKNKQIILFDSVCNLCDSAVQQIIKYDKKDIFRFVSLQSELGIKIIKHIGISERNIDSIVLYQPKIAYYYKSKAVYKIAKNLHGLLLVFSVFDIFPTVFSDFFYDLIARNRYNWFGKENSCLISTPALKSKFLE